MVYGLVALTDPESPVSVVSVYYTPEGNDSQRKLRTSWILTKVATAAKYQAKLAAQFENS